MQCSAIGALIATRESPSFVEGRMSRSSPSLSRRGNRRQAHRLSSGLFRRNALQRRGHQILLLLFVQGGNTRGGGRRGGAARIEKLLVRSQPILQPIAQLVQAVLGVRPFLAAEGLP